MRDLTGLVKNKIKDGIFYGIIIKINEKTLIKQRLKKKNGAPERIHTFIPG